MCKQCNVYLCFKEDARGINCFESFHRDAKFGVIEEEDDDSSEGSSEEV